jgi:ABC-type polar amino acid transport system ATPase subunit
LALKIVKSFPIERAVELAMAIGAKLGLESIFSSYPNEISGGQSQRVALARAYVMYPSILLLDEVTSAIDPSTINSVIKLLEELRDNEATKKTSVIMVTHNIRFAIDHSDYIAFMENGTFIEIHKSNEFLSKAFDNRTKTYINDSKYFT